MAVGFGVDCLWYPIGNGDFLYAFFSTVCVLLENGEWGSNYPVLMNELYAGRLRWQNVCEAKEELEDVQRRLKDFSPVEVIWNAEDLTKSPPWGRNISKDISDLSNYFVTSSGDDLITVILNVFEKAEKEKVDVDILSL